MSSGSVFTLKNGALLLLSINRQLFMLGRNIAARTLYGLTFPGEDWPGRTPQELAADYDLPLAAVEEAIAYCASNPPEIRADWEMEEALMQATTNAIVPG
jgi:hypothetical protein